MGSDGGSIMFEPKVNLKTQFVPQGISADLIATLGDYSREDVDSFAFESQKRATIALNKGYFKSIIPLTDQNGLKILDYDEHIRPKTTMEDLRALKPSFETIGNLGFDQIAIGKYAEVESINHVHTAGNSSGIVDGAATVLIGSKQKGNELCIVPRAKIISIATVSKDSTIMLTGLGPASKKALKKVGIDDMGLDSTEKVNVNGGAIAMGHPIGATGAMLLGTAIDEMERRDLNTGLITLCAAGGMGISTIIERV